MAALTKRRFLGDEGAQGTQLAGVTASGRVKSYESILAIVWASYLRSGRQAEHCEACMFT